MIKDLHSTDDCVVLYLLCHFLIKPREQVRLQHDGDRQPEAKQEAGALQPLCRPAYHQGPTWGVRQGEEDLLSLEEEGGDYLYLDRCFN